MNTVVKILSIFITITGFTSISHCMVENERYHVLQEIIESSGKVKLKPLPLGGSLSTDDIESLARLVTDRKKYKNLSQYAICDNHVDVNQILSRVFMKECASADDLSSAIERREIPSVCFDHVLSLSQRFLFVLVLPHDRLVYGVKRTPLSKLVAFDSQECREVGFIEWDKTSYGFHILKLDVSDDFRQQKIGSVLMTLALRYFEDARGAEKKYKVTLTACSEDPTFLQEKLTQFYQKFGFKFVVPFASRCLAHEMVLHHPQILVQKT